MLMPFVSQTSVIQLIRKLVEGKDENMLRRAYPKLAQEDIRATDRYAVDARRLTRTRNSCSGGATTGVVSPKASTDHEVSSVVRTPAGPRRKSPTGARFRGPKKISMGKPCSIRAQLSRVDVYHRPAPKPRIITASRGWSPVARFVELGIEEK